MKPIRSNSQKETCSPISSNCVVWQGPDLPCINLCNGDSVSDVTYKMAEEVCALKQDLGLSDIDLTCLVQVCQTTAEPTKTLSNILKLLVAKVCCLSDIVENIPNPGTPYVEPTLNLTPCLQYENDTSIELKLEPYVLRMAAFLCQVNNTVETNSSDIVELQGKVAALENAPDPTPQISSCLLQGLEDIDVVVEELEQQFCSYKTALGTIGDINIVPTRQCEDLNGALQLATREPMVNLNGWKTNVQSLAQSLNNLWLTVCDIRDAVSLIQSSCCSINCDDIVVDFDYTWINESTLNAFFVPKTNLPAGFWDCNPSGNLYRVEDGNGSIKEVTILLRKQNPSDQTGALTNPTYISGGYPIVLTPSSLQTGTGLKITANLCFTNGDVTCIKCFTKEIGPYVNTECCTITSSVVNTIVYELCYSPQN
jgi:hypothetical protein